MQTFSEYIKYDIEEYYCPTSSISMRKVHVNMILFEFYLPSLQLVLCSVAAVKRLPVHQP